jgi:hypothetical protein
MKSVNLFSCPPKHTKGKCGRCRIVFHWPSATGRLLDAWCPLCGEKLVATTHLSKFMFVERQPNFDGGTPR